MMNQCWVNYRNVNINRAFESASYIGITRNKNRRVSLPWSGESVVDGRTVRWNIHIRAGKTLTVTAGIRHNGQWRQAAIVEETAYEVHKHPTEAAAFQIDRAIGAMLEYLVSAAYWRNDKNFIPAPRLLEA